MKNLSHTKSLLAITGSSLLAISSSHAQANGTWNQTGTANPYEWSDIANWLDGIVAGGTDATASFTVNPSGAQTVNLDSAVTLGNITLNRNQNLTIAGPETLTLDVTTGIPNISVSSGRNITISSVIAGNDGLQASGAGILVLTGTNTYTGGTLITGRLHAASDAALGGAGAITLDGGILHGRSNANTGSGGGGGANISSARNVIIGANGGEIAVNGNNNFTTTGVLSGSNTFTAVNVGGAGGRSINFNSTSNTFTGDFAMNSAGGMTVQVNSLGGGNNVIFNQASIFRYGAGATAAVSLGAVHLNNVSGTISNFNTTHGITISSNLIATGGGAKTLELSAVAGPTNIFAGNISNETDGGTGTVALNKSGGGTWELRGANTFTGNTTVTAGTLTLADVSSMRFEIGASGINNSILGTGTANLNGAFFFDLANASTNNGDFWNIVSVGTLSETYGSTFSVNSTLGAFTESGSGIWNLTNGDDVWTFSQSTGDLSFSVIPEPSVALLGGLGMLCLLRRRR